MLVRLLIFLMDVETSDAGAAVKYRLRIEAGAKNAADPEVWAAHLSPGMKSIYFQYVSMDFPGWMTKDPPFFIMYIMFYVYSSGSFGTSSFRMMKKHVRCNPDVAPRLNSDKLIGVRVGANMFYCTGAVSKVVIDAAARDSGYW